MNSQRSRPFSRLSRKREIGISVSRLLYPRGVIYPPRIIVPPLTLVAFAKPRVDPTARLDEKARGQGKRRRRKKKRRPLVAISRYYLHLRRARCGGPSATGDASTSDKRTGTGIPPPHTHRNLPVCISLFSLSKCARAARGRARDTVGRRIKPGFYYKRIQIPRTRPSPYGVLRGGVRRGTRREAERERERERS